MYIRTASNADQLLAQQCACLRVITLVYIQRCTNHSVTMVMFIKRYINIKKQGNAYIRVIVFFNSLKRTSQNRQLKNAATYNENASACSILKDLRIKNSQLSFYLRCVVSWFLLVCCILYVFLLPSFKFIPLYICKMIFCLFSWVVLALKRRQPNAVGIPYPSLGWEIRVSTCMHIAVV